MNAALELFHSNGYKKTMIIDITKKAGTAKGTFYHYYPSKEAILEAICSRWAATIAADFQQTGSQLEALSKLTLFIERLFLSYQLNMLFKRLWEEEQLNLYYKTWKSLVEGIFNPLLTNIIKQGLEEQVMHISCQHESIAFLWATLTCVWEAIFFQEAPTTIAAKVNIAQSLLENILGLETNTLTIKVNADWLKPPTRC